MATASGIAKSLRYKAESTFGTAPGASGAQLLRRVESTVDLSKSTYQSAELRTDYQVSDFRHGVRSVGGNIKGELSPGTYKDFIAAAMRAASWTAGVSVAAMTLTIAANGTQYNVTRSAGSFLSDGFKVGDIIRFTGGLGANNTAKNCMITAITSATIIVVDVVMPNGTLTPEGPTSAVTTAVQGKKCFTPQTAQADASFAIEHWFADVAQSELFLGCKVNTLDLNLPATGMSDITMGFMGQNVQTATSAYYTSPTASTTSGVCAAVNGAVAVGGTPVGVLTSLSIKVAGGYTADPVVGSNIAPAIFPGRVQVSGQLPAFFQDATLRDAFLNETAISILAAFTADNTANSDFMALSMTRVKLGGATKSDGEKGILITAPFTALLDTAGGATLATNLTTLTFQDSLA